MAGARQFLLIAAGLACAASSARSQDRFVSLLRDEIGRHRLLEGMKPTVVHGPRWKLPPGSRGGAPGYFVCHSHEAPLLQWEEEGRGTVVYCGFSSLIWVRRPDGSFLGPRRTFQYLLIPGCRALVEEAIERVEAATRRKDPARELAAIDRLRTLGPAIVPFLIEYVELRKGRTAGTTQEWVERSRDYLRALLASSRRDAGGWVEDLEGKSPIAALAGLGRPYLLLLWDLTSYPSRRQVEILDRFVRRHPGAVAVRSVHVGKRFSHLVANFLTRTSPERRTPMRLGCYVNPPPGMKGPDGAEITALPVLYYIDAPARGATLWGKVLHRWVGVVEEDRIARRVLGGGR